MRTDQGSVPDVGRSEAPPHQDLVGRRPVLVRGAVLGLLMAVLTAASLSPFSLSGVVFYARYVIAGLLLALTWTFGVPAKRPWSEVPGSTRSVIACLWALGGVGLVSVTWSVAPAVSLAQVLVYALMVLLLTVHVTHWWTTPAAVRRDVMVMYVVLSGFSLGSLADGRLLGERLAGLFINPNMLALVTASAFMLGLALLSVRASILVVAVELGLAVTLLQTETRSAITGVVIGMFLFVLGWAFHQRVGVHWVVGVCLAIGGGLFFFLFGGRVQVPHWLAPVVQRFDQHAASGQEALGSRAEGWGYAMDLWSARPAGGYGFRAGEIAFQQHRSATSFAADGAHNSYLQLLLEIGLVGMAPAILLLVALLVTAVRLPAPGAPRLGPTIVMGLVACIFESALFGVGQVFCWTFWLVSVAALSAPGRVSDP